MNDEDDQYVPIYPSYTLEDTFTADNNLPFSLYAYAISRFLTHPRTRTPTYVSIQAPSGFGRTSLMRMLQQNLDKDVFKHMISFSREASEKPATIAELLNFLESEEKETEEKFQIKQPNNVNEGIKPRLTIWLSALAYEEEELAWPIITDAIITQVAARLSTKERDLFFFHLHLRRQGLEEFKQVVYDRISSYCRKKAIKWTWILPITLIVAAAFMIISNANIPGVSLGLAGIVISIVLGIVQILQQRQNIELLRTPWDQLLWFISRVKKKPAWKILKEYVNIPIYIPKASPTEEMLEDLRTTFERIPQEFLPLIIFIDDLDLCSPNKIASILETITISFPRRFPYVQFIIGYDREIVSPALETKYNLGIDMRSLPERYTDKNYPDARSYLIDRIEELSIIIPPIEQNNVEKYLDTLLEKDKSTEYVVQNQTDKYTTIDNNKRDRVSNEMEKEFVEVEFVKKQDIKELDEKIDTFNENNTEILNLMRDTLYFLGRDARKIARFETVFRFHYTLYSAKKARNVRILSLTQLRDWILLSWKWPDIIHWLYHEDSPCSELKNGTNNILDSVRRKLILLEYLSSRGWSNNKRWRTDKRWRAEIDEYPVLESIINRWLADKCLGKFFDKQLKLKYEDRLSSSKTGLF